MLKQQKYDDDRERGDDGTRQKRPPVHRDRAVRLVQVKQTDGERQFILGRGQERRLEQDALKCLTKICTMNIVRDA